MPPIYNPTGYRAGYVTPTKPTRRKTVGRTVRPGEIAGGGYGAYDPNDSRWGQFAPPGPDEAGTWQASPSWGTANGSGFLADFPGLPGYENATGSEIWDYGGGAGVTGPPGGRNSITLGGEPAYRGILDRFTGDWRARINAGAADMQTRRLSNARALINRLGVRDPNQMLGQVGQYGLTLADLQAAASNPFSELQAIGKQATAQRGAMIADRAARGGIRSGGSSRGVRLVEEGRARAEALASQEALQGLAEQQFQQRDWERQAWDDFYQRSNELEMQLAQQYQPQEAVWDAASGGYRYGNKVYDQNGNLIRTY